MKGNREIVELLLNHGASPAAVNAAGATPLHDAALGGSKPVVELLLDKGADVNAVDRETGATPLHNAASWGRTEAIAILLAHGADSSLKNRAGLTPLRAAVQNNQPEAAALLKPKR